jgi:hypothetical protein
MSRCTLVHKNKINIGIRDGSTKSIKEKEFSRNIDRYIAESSVYNIVVNRKYSPPLVVMPIEKLIFESHLVTVPPELLNKMLLNGGSPCFLVCTERLYKGLVITRVFWNMLKSTPLHKKINSILAYNSSFCESKPIYVEDLLDIRLDTLQSYVVIDKGEFIGHIIPLNRIKGKLDEFIINSKKEEDNKDPRYLKIKKSDIYRSKHLALEAIGSKIVLITEYNKPKFSIINDEMYEKIKEDLGLPNLVELEEHCLISLFEYLEKNNKRICRIKRIKKAVGIVLNIELTESLITLASLRELI